MGKRLHAPRSSLLVDEPSATITPLAPSPGVAWLGLCLGLRPGRCDLVGRGAPSPLRLALRHDRGGWGPCWHVHREHLSYWPNAEFPQVTADLTGRREH